MLNARYFRSGTALTSKKEWEETYSSIESHLSSTLSRSKSMVIAVNPTSEKKRTRAEYPHLFHTVINHKLIESTQSSETVDESKLQFLTHQGSSRKFLTHQGIPQYIVDNCDRLPEFMSIPKTPPHISDVPARLKLIQRYLGELSYNHLGHPFFEVRTDRVLTKT
jgi:hypothetical protein